MRSCAGSWTRRNWRSGGPGRARRGRAATRADPMGNPAAQGARGSRLLPPGTVRLSAGRRPVRRSLSWPRLWRARLLATNSSVLSRAHAEPAAIVAPAKAVLAVAGGRSFADAARSAGRRSGVGCSLQSGRAGSPQIGARRGQSKRYTQPEQTQPLGSVPTPSGGAGTMPSSPGTKMGAGARPGRRCANGRAER